MSTPAVCLQSLSSERFFGTTVRFPLIWEAGSTFCSAFSGDRRCRLDQASISENFRMDRKDPADSGKGNVLADDSVYDHKYGGFRSCIGPL